MGEQAEPAAGYVGPDHVGDGILCVEHLSFRYPGGVLALQDIHLHARRGATLAIVGPNGAGKTTLLKVVLGLLDGYTGSVRVAGMSPIEARRAGDVVSWVPQHAHLAWDFPVRVASVVRMGLVGKTGMFRRYRRDDLDYVEHLMDVLDLGGIGRRQIGSVSGGQQQRAIIARALAPRPKLLLLDEPTVGVDEAGREAFGNLMEQIKRRFALTLVIVSHDLRTVLRGCQRVACLNRTLHFHDTPDRLTPELLGEVFRCDLTGLLTGPPVPAQGACPYCPPAQLEGAGHDP